MVGPNKMTLKEAVEAYKKGDKYNDKALKTWKENNLEKELDPFIQSKYPNLITDPTQKTFIEI
ncbi:hypothetical protein psyc5s11_21270 [Clostridium gelidum]|uniref:Uncharacterized protein n=2 Tax=Clostridium gelidum TaxID=704125 RepID=A0ABM7TAT3_9CLOT|nr:hypothetical protein psyc5s11_21270 [Clostridium gelidum]